MDNRNLQDDHNHGNDAHVVSRDVKKTQTQPVNVLLFIFQIIGVKTNFGTCIKDRNGESIVPKSKIPVKVVGQFYGENQAANDALTRQLVDNGLAGKKKHQINIFPGFDVAIFDTERRGVEECSWISFGDSYMPHIGNMNCDTKIAVPGFIFENKNKSHIVLRGQLSIRTMGTACMALLCFTTASHSGSMLTNGTMIPKTKILSMVPSDILSNFDEQRLGQIFYPHSNYNLVRMRIEAVYHEKPCSNGKIRLSVCIDNKMPHFSVFLDDTHFTPWKVHHVILPGSICWGIGWNIDLERRIFSNVGGGASYATILPQFYQNFFFGKYTPDLESLPNISDHQSVEAGGQGMAAQSAIDDFL